MRVESTAPVRQHDHCGACGDGRAHPVHDLVHTKAFVEMGAPGEDRRDLARERRDDPERAAVTDHGRRCTARQLSQLAAADQLAKIAVPLAALVNLLPLHPGGAPDLTPSARAQMLAFERRLKERGVEAVLRRSRGLDISAACGQLRVEVEARRRKVRTEEHAHIE